MADFTGTAADDTFNARATNATTGAAATTVNDGDTLDGGAGKDTLNITSTADNNRSLTGLATSNIETVNIAGANNLGTLTSASAAPTAGAAQVQVLDITGARFTGEVQSIDFAGMTIATAGNVTIAGTTVALAAGDGPAAIAKAVSAKLALLTTEIASVTQTGSKLTVTYLAASATTGADLPDPAANRLTVATDANTSPVGLAAGSTSLATVNQTLTTVTTFSASNSVTVNVNGNSYVVDVADVANLNATAVAAPAAPTVATTQGVAVVTAVNESSVVTFGQLTVGQTVTVNGKTLTATGTVSANDVAAFFGSVGTIPALGTASGTQGAGFTVGAASTNTVTYTSATAATNVTDVAISVGVNTSVGGGGSATAPTAPTVVTTDGVAAVTAVTESSVVTFGDLLKGQAVTVAGETVTAAADMTAAEVTSEMFAKTFTGFADAAISGSTTSLKFTSSGAGNVADIVVSTAGSGSTSARETAVTNTVNAVSGLLNKVLAGAVTVGAGDEAGEIKLTSNTAGTALPTITVSQGTTSRSSVDTADGATVAAAVRTQVAAGKQVVSITVDDGNTTTFAGTETFELFVNGASQGVTAIGVNKTEAEVASAIASAINTSLGISATNISNGTANPVAVALGATVTMTAAVAGTALPVIGVNLVAPTVAAPSAPSVAETTAGGSGVAEVSTVTFGSLVHGQSVTFAGRTVTATGDMTGAQVATAFNSTSPVATNGLISGTLSGTTSVSSATVVHTGAVGASGSTNPANLVVTTAGSANEGSLTFAELTANTQAVAQVVSAGSASVSADQFVGSELVNLSGASGSATVTGVTAGQTIGFTGVAMANTVAFGALTSGSIAVNASAGTLATSGDALTTLALSGTGTTGLTITDGGTVAATGLDPITTLNLSTSGSTVLNTAAMGSLATLTQSGEGGVRLTPGSKLASITTGAGADTLRVSTATAIDNLGTTTNEAVNAVVNSGAGSDRLVITTTGAGTTTVDAGTGDDTLFVTGLSTGQNSLSGGDGNDAFRITGSIAGLQNVTINGGAGNDTLRISNTAFTASDYTILTANVSSVETLELSGVVTALDASKVSATALRFLASGSAVTEVGSGQAVTLARTAAATATTGFTETGVTTAVNPALITVSSKGYILDNDATATGNQTVFGDNLGVTLTNTAADTSVVAKGNVLTLGVAALGTSSTVTGNSTVATVTGDLTGINVALQSARGSGTVADVENVAGFIASVSTTNLDDVSSITVTGSGTATITAGTIPAVDAKLTTINVSGMTAFADQNLLGDLQGGVFTNRSTTTITLNNFVSETVLLGGAKDTVVTGSVYAKADTVTGFQLTASAVDPLVVDLTRSDVLKIGVGFTATNAAKMTVTGSTIEAALLQAAGLKDADGGNVNNVVFHFGGNTYAYVDTNNDGLTDNDQLVALSGTLNLDLLLQAGVIIA